MAREGAEVWATDINQDALAQLARQAQAEGLARLRTRALNVLDTQAVQACARRSARWTRCSTAPATSTPATSSNARNPMGLRHGPERQVHAPHDPRLPAGHARTRRRLHHQHVLGRFQRQGVLNRYAYGASKAAVIGLTKAVAADFVARGIRCNAICPAPSNRPRCATHRHAGAPGRHRRRDRARRLRGPPAHRPRRPRRSRGAGGHLASDESAFTTGTIQVIDGGWSN